MAKIQQYLADSSTLQTSGQHTPRFSGSETAGIMAAYQSLGSNLTRLGETVHQLNKQKEEKEYSSSELSKFRTTWDTNFIDAKTGWSKDKSPDGFTRDFFETPRDVTVIEDGREVTKRFNYQQHADYLKSKFTTKDGQRAVDEGIYRYKESVHKSAYSWEAIQQMEWNTKNREEAITGWTNEILNGTLADPTSMERWGVIEQQVESQIAFWSASHKLTPKQVSTLRTSIKHDLAKARADALLDSAPEVLQNELAKSTPDWAKGLTSAELTYYKLKADDQELKNSAALVIQTERNIDDSISSMEATGQGDVDLNIIRNNSCLSPPCDANVEKYIVAARNAKGYHKQREVVEGKLLLNQDESVIEMMPFLADGNKNPDYKASSWEIVDDAKEINATERQVIAGRVLASYESRIKQFNNAPASYVLQNDLTVSQAYEAAVDGNDPNLWKAYIDASITSQINNGMAEAYTEVIPDPIVDRWLTQIQNNLTNPKKLTDVFAQMENYFGGAEGEYWPRIRQEFAEKSSQTLGSKIEFALLTYDNIHLAPYAKSYLSMTEKDIADLRLSGEKSADFVTAAESGLAKYAEVFGFDANSSKQLAELEQTVVDLAIMHGRSTNSGPSESVDFILDNLINKHASFVTIPGDEVDSIVSIPNINSDTGKPVVPEKVHAWLSNTSSFEDVARTFGFGKNQLDVIKQQPWVTDEFANSEMALTAGEYGHWRNDGHNNYIYVITDLSGAEIPLMYDGKTISVSLDQIMNDKIPFVPYVPSPKNDDVRPTPKYSLDELRKLYTSGKITHLEFIQQKKLHILKIKDDEFLPQDNF